MNTNVEALQRLYVKMCGNPEDVSDKTTISEMIDAITAIGIVDKVARSGNYITATTAAELNNKDAIYVYTGSEEGYNQGHLYYWDGTAFVDGGEYNGARAEIDPTLSHTGKAADAKKTGDALASLNGSLGDLPSIMYGDSLVNYNLDYDGYIEINGTGIHAQTNTLERYSEYIPVEPNTVYALDARMKSPGAAAASFWVNTVIYNSEKEPITSRTSAGAATGIDEHGYYYKTILLTMPATAAYFRITARTYGDAIFTMYKKTSDIDVTRASLQKFKRDIDGKITEAVSGIDINNDTGYSVVYSPNAYDYVCKSINHRGYNNYPSNGCPENTIPAYRAAKTAGFYYVETDVRITSDGHFVLLHDVSINRTARNSDGTTIENTVNIADITLETALTYDFGIFKGETYAGTKIPTLEEFLLYCKGACLHPYVEIKFPHDEDEVKRLVDVVNSYGMKDRVTYIANSNDSLKTISQYNPTARLGQLVSNIGDNGVTNTIGLRSGHNEVFICSQTSDGLTAERVANIVNSNIGVELWCYDASVSGITSKLTNYPIVTGIIHNKLLAGQEFYDFTVGVENSGT